MTETRTFRVWHYRILWGMAFFSMLFNAVLIGTLVAVRSEVQQTLSQAAGAFAGLELDSFEYELHVEQTIPLDMTIPFNDTFTVPISATVPVSTMIPFNDTFVVPINSNLPVNTTVNVPITIPLLGSFNVPFPISTNVPVNLTVEVPISREIPVQMTIPVNLLVDVPISTEVPVQADIPIVMDVPVNIPLDNLGFGTAIAEVQAAMSGWSWLVGE